MISSVHAQRASRPLHGAALLADAHGEHATVLEIALGSERQPVAQHPPGDHGRPGRGGVGPATPRKGHHPRHDCYAQEPHVRNLLAETPRSRDTSTQTRNRQPLTMN